MYSSGFIFRGKGYETKFIYGGYGYFDNMNEFFSNNGFDVVDSISDSINKWQQEYQCEFINTDEKDK